MAKKKSVIVTAANKRDAIESISYLIGVMVTTRMTPGTENGRPYGDSRMPAMMQAIVDKTVPAKFVSFDFKIRLRQTLGGVISSP